MAKRKKKWRLKKKFRILFSVITLLLLYIIIKNIFFKDNKIAVVSTEEKINELLNQSSYLSDFDNNSYNITNKQKEYIIKYLNTYYKSLIELKTKDTSVLFNDKNSVEAYLNMNAIDLLVQHHKMQFNDMRLTFVSYDVKITDVKNENDKLKISFDLDEKIKFAYLDNYSYSYGIDHEITFENNKISSVRVTNNYYVMFTNVLNNPSKNEILTLKENYLKSIKEDLNTNKELLKEANEKKYDTTIKCDGKYDRKAAVNYSYKYILKRNSEYGMYDGLGGNCQNFASQSVHAGGIPMDTTGFYQWKHYGTELNESNTTEGRSSSWTGTINFYEYAQNNKDGGVCGETDLNIFYGEPGDVGQVGYDGYSHTVLIVEQVLDKNGNITDLLVNSNTVTLKDYPFLAYVYPNKRIIKILGYYK